MPRSSRHKSSKHSSRDARDYSDSDRDSALKDKMPREETSAKVSKDLGSSEKRKQKHSSDVRDLGNGQLAEGPSSSKRRKDRSADEGSGGDRWNGGEAVDPSSKSGSEKAAAKSRASNDSKSKSGWKHDGLTERREETEEVKKSSKSKLDRDSSRREVKEGVSERERKGKEGKGDKLFESGTGEVVDREVSKKHGSSEDEHRVKKAEENTSSKMHDGLRKPEPENEPEKRTRKRRDGSTDWDKHGEDKNGINDRLFSSRDDISRNGRYKDEIIKDKHHDDKWRDGQSTKDLTSSRSDDKHYRDEKDAEEIWKKKSKPRDREHDCDRDCEHDRDRERKDNRDRDHVHDRVRDREYDRDRYREHDREPRRYRDRDREHDCDREYNHDLRRDEDCDVRESRRDRDRERNHERDCESHRDRERDLGNNRRRDRHGTRDLERYRDHDPDGYCDRGRGHDRHHSMSLADQNCGYKDSRGKKRSLNDHDDRNDMKSRCVKVDHPDMEKRSMNSGKLDSDTDKGRSQFLQSHVDNSITNKNQNYREGDFGNDAQRHFNHVNSKYVDSATELRPGTGFSRDLIVSGAPDRVSKYRPSEKIDDDLLGELSVERSSSSKASPMGLIERSPSSIDRRGTNRTGSRKNLDVDGRARRNGGPYDVRDSIKTLANESALAEPFINKPNQYIFSSSRSGIDSPARCLVEEDSRNTSSTPYRRNADSNMERGHVNPWKGVSNWSPTIPNSFIPFQHGPPPGGFQGLVPHFPFGVRPSLDANHPGIPYPFPDADRFPSNVGPLGWQNMVDSSGIGHSHMHGWDGHNGVFRGEPRMYAGPGWDHKMRSVDERIWDANADMNGDLNSGILSSSKNDDYPMKSPTKEVLAQSAEQQSGSEIYNHGVGKSIEIERSSCSSQGKEAPMSQPKSSHEKTFQVSKMPGGNNSLIFAAYLSKLDISTELAQPELYSRCMRLLDLDPSATVEEDFTKNMNGNCGGGIVTKAPYPDSTFSLLPTIKNSVFERALDLYKKQKVENSSFKKGSVDLSAASGQEKVEEHIPMSEPEKSEEPLPVLDPTRVDDGLILTSGQVISKDLVDAPAYKVQENGNPPSMSSKENPEPPQNFEVEEPEERTCEQEDKDGGRDRILSHENSEDLPSIISHPSPKGCDLGDGLSRENLSCYSSCFVKDQPQEAVALGDPLDGSNDESELVSLSRIHHSPESTH